MLEGCRGRILLLCWGRVRPRVRGGGGGGRWAPLCVPCVPGAVPEGTQLVPTGTTGKWGCGPGVVGQEPPAFPFSREGLWLQDPMQENFLLKQTGVKGGFCPKMSSLPLPTWVVFLKSNDLSLCSLQGVLEEEGEIGLF